MTDSRYKDITLADLKGIAKLLDKHVLELESDDLAERVASMSADERAQYLSRARGNESTDGPLCQPTGDRPVPGAFGRPLGELVVSLIDAVIGTPFGGQVGAAAGHRSDAVTPKWHSAFILRWRQGDAVWRMEGRHRHGLSEVALSCDNAPHAAPISLEWSNSKTGQIERAPIIRGKDGRLLVKILLLKAVRRVKAMADTAGGSVEKMNLPIVRFDTE